MSNRLKGLREKRATVIDAAEAITAKAEKEKRLTLTAEERTAHDGHLAEIKDLDGDITREVELERVKAASATSLLSPGETREREGLPAMSSARQMFLPTKNIKGEKSAERAYWVGRFFLGVLGYQRSIDLCEEHGMKFMPTRGVAKAMSGGIGSAGGYTIPDEVMNEIITLRDSFGFARQYCRIVPMGRDTITQPKWVSGLTAYFVDDKGTAVTTSDPVLQQIGLTAKALATLTYVSRDLDEDSAVSIGDFLAAEIATALSNKEDDCLFNGDGTSTYGGMTGLRTIFNAGVGSLAGAVDAASGVDTMAEITVADLAAAQAKLPDYVYKTGNPAWICSRTVFANVFERLIGASGGVTKDQASGRTIMEYNGYPILTSSKCLAPAAATTNFDDVAILFFGDISMASMFGDRRGMEVETSTEYRFANRQNAILGSERFDINNHGTGSTSEAGPIVALMGE